MSFYKDKFPELRANEISFNSDGIIVRGEQFKSENPRMSFIKALAEFEQYENNTFESMPNGTRIQVDTFIGENVKYGCNCVFGGAGFGYEPDEDGKLIRMPHLSHVEINDNVIIHNLVNIDRGVLSPTIIGEGTVIDSLTHVAHGAVIGKHCAIIGAGIGGSTVIGDNCYIGFRAVVKQKLKIGCNAKIGMGAIVLVDVPDNHLDWIKGIWKG